ncbi:hypothetical protein ITP53_34000 [Nonomuraea sp. K274]|uniref:Uncharacterized protein n=1 Tax=Nonomuraea cypriaca TaxID=1187855 RepID=A0A931F401_9ACTN|nr:hypothetical protein [Nonomuraea cypriaca]MBF8190641.1 hypothetical protein [Nonomuraea cypriaca]
MLRMSVSSSRLVTRVMRVVVAIATARFCSASGEASAGRRSATTSR